MLAIQKWEWGGSTLIDCSYTSWAPRTHAGVALAALPRLQLELTPSPGTPVCSANKPCWCD
jgi:hypothetical protein